MCMVTILWLGIVSCNIFDEIPAALHSAQLYLTNIAHKIIPNPSYSFISYIARSKNYFKPFLPVLLPNHKSGEVISFITFLPFSTILI